MEAQIQNPQGALAQEPTAAQEAEAFRVVTGAVAVGQWVEFSYDAVRKELRVAPNVDAAGKVVPGIALEAGAVGEVILIQKGGLGFANAAVPANGANAVAVGAAAGGKTPVWLRG